MEEIELHKYDSERAVEEFDGCRIYHIPSAVLDGKMVSTYGGDVDDLPSKIDGMSEEQKQAYFLEMETEDELDDLDEQPRA